MLWEEKPEFYLKIAQAQLAGLALSCSCHAADEEGLSLLKPHQATPEFKAFLPVGKLRSRPKPGRT